MGMGLARALVSQPRLLCLDDAFSALDVLTAENLRQKLVHLWRNARHRPEFDFHGHAHNIEEAVQMATRIVVLFPHPARLGLVLVLVLNNPLPCPRDTKSAEFQKFVSVIYECITTTTMPDHPVETTAPGAPISRSHNRMESIPLVPVGQIVGLPNSLNDKPELSDIYEISAQAPLVSHHHALLHEHEEVKAKPSLGTLSAPFLTTVRRKFFRP